MFRDSLLLIVSVIAGFSYLAGETIMAVALGILVVRSFYLRVKTPSGETSSTEADISIGKVKLMVPQLFLIGLLMIWVSQLVFKFDYLSIPSSTPSALCFICNSRNLTNA